MFKIKWNAEQNGGVKKNCVNEKKNNASIKPFYFCNLNSELLCGKQILLFSDKSF